jgi:hypothetical protein
MQRRGGACAASDRRWRQFFDNREQTPSTQRILKIAVMSAGEKLEYTTHHSRYA